MFAPRLPETGPLSRGVATELTVRVPETVAGLRGLVPARDRVGGPEPTSSVVTSTRIKEHAGAARVGVPAEIHAG